MSSTLATSHAGLDGVNIAVLLSAFSPLPRTISLTLPANTGMQSILAAVVERFRLPSNVADMLRLSQRGGQQVSSTATLSTLAGTSVMDRLGRNVIAPVTMELRVGLKGGKGGFGSMLRAQGGKMSSNRNGEENNDACRDLNGRRLSTVKQARQLASYLSTQAEREKELSEAQKKKYAKLEKMLGRKPKGEADFVEAAQKLHEEGGSLEEGEGEGNEESGPSVSLARKPVNISEVKGTKRDRIQDSEYIEQSREIVDNVRSAVASAMMKKKNKNKKQKMTPTAATEKAPIPAAQSV
jgi:hypothetical protein